MSFLMNVLAGLAGLYSLLIFIRILLTWFSGANYGKPVEILAWLTDPYLNWWRRIPGLRLGYLDLSPIAAMASLSIIQTIFYRIAHYGRISLGVILSIGLAAFWSVVSFILGFCIIVLVLRFIAYITNRGIYGGFWQIIDTISRPLLYRTNRIIFGKRLVNYTTGLITAIIALIVIWICGKFLIGLIGGLLGKSPV
ncbi:MAG: YggT family protein [Treponema sp.]|nr:YggT family protein [Treponema sp.]